MLLERYVALALTLFTGLTALVYEVTWHAYLANLLGSQARSTALIVATFLGGLSVGYQIFGRYSRQRSSRTLVQICGVLEVLIGVWALVFKVLYDFTFSLHFGHALLRGSLIGDMLLAILLIGPPTAMMGASLPLLTQGLSRNLEDAAPFHAKIYVINTLGAFIGAVSAGFYFLPTFGLSVTMQIMGIVNIIAGIIFVLIAWRLSPVPTPKITIARNSDASEKLSRFWMYLTLAAAGGFVSITIQTALVRIVALSLGASVYAFSVVVSAFILALALGAWGIAERRLIALSLYQNQVLLVLGIVALYLAIPYLPYSAHIFRTLLTNQPPTFAVFQSVAFVVLVLLLLVPVGSLGAALPLLFRESRDRHESLGTRVGALYGANTLGCVCGAVIGGYLSFTILDLDGVWKGCMVVAALMLILLGYDSKTRLAIGVVALILPFTLSSWPRYVLGRGLFRMSTPTPFTYRGFSKFYESYNSSFSTVGYKDDPNSSICVTKDKDGDLSILVNGKSDGNTRGGDRVTTKLMAHIPALLQSSTSDRAAVVGFGTGITVGSLAKHSEIGTIDILEISSAVRDFAPLFDAHNSDASKSTKIRWNMGDAYRFLMESRDTYAIIASEPSNPWVGGVERLYSREFYQLVRSKLAQGGVYAQWFHTYSVSEETVALVLRTFRESFPYHHLFQRDSDFILIGANERLHAPHLNLMGRRLQETSIKEDLKDINIIHMNQLLLAEAWMPWDGLGDAEVHTLDRPRLSYWAGKDFFLQRDAKISTFAARPDHKGWSVKAFPNTLLGGLFASTPDTNERMKAMELMYCGEDEQEPEQWSKHSPRCKHVRFALVLRGLLSPAAQIPEGVVAGYRTLLRTTAGTPPQPESISEIGEVLDWVFQFGGPFIDVDPQKIRQYAEQCYKTQDEVSSGCRSRVVLALAGSGFFTEAQSEFRFMLDDEMPFRNREGAERLARIAGVQLSKQDSTKIISVEDSKSSL